jgi:DNA repair protein SbcC/Rad50
MILKTLTFENFKGIASLTLNFPEKHNYIHGDNGTCKSSVMDGYIWLLFGKNADGKTDSGKGKFEVRTLTPEGDPIHNLTHSVEATFEGNFPDDTTQFTAKRILEEKWTKKHGSEEAELTGTVTKFEWNGVPKSQSEFNAKRDAIIKEELFKLLSDPLAFNNSMPWNSRREMVIKLVGFENNDKLLMANQPTFAELIPELTGKTLAEYQKEIAAKKKKITDVLDLIPTRINENTVALPEDLAPLSVLLEAKATVQLVIDKLNEDLSNQTNNSSIEKLNALNKKKLEIQKELGDIQTAASKDILTKFNQREQELAQLNTDLENIDKVTKENNAKIEANTKKITELSETNNGLRTQMSELNKKVFVFDPKASLCPNLGIECKPYKEGNYKVLEAKFNTELNAEAKRIQEQGTANKAEIEKLEKENNALAEENNLGAMLRSEKSETLADLEKAKLGVKTSQSIMEENPRYHELKKEDKECDTQIEELVKAKPDNTPILTDIKNKQAEIEKLQSSIALHDAQKLREYRIAELKEQQRKLSGELSAQEKIEKTINQYNKFKIGFINQRIAEVFPTVRFKMFEEQLNGGLNDNLCETMVNGVTWTDLNSAARINAGMEIISVIQKHTGICPPIFIDNRESVVELFETEAQTINLVVDKKCKKLTLV